MSLYASFNGFTDATTADGLGCLPQDIFAAFTRLFLMYKGENAFIGGPIEAASFVVKYAGAFGILDKFLGGNPGDVVLDVLNMTSEGDDEKQNLGEGVVKVFAKAGLPVGICRPSSPPHSVTRPCRPLAAGHRGEIAE
eukprot:1179576-Prorocentrum_minimum.AAC.13